MRTGVKAAILSYNLPDAQVSPYELTTPRLLDQMGYANALIGKYHLGGPENNPSGLRAPEALGWKYFNGLLVGGPPFIDPSLGGQTADLSLYTSGFPLGPTRGVGWFLDSNGNAYADDNSGNGYTGQECYELGGIAALDESGRFATRLDEASIRPDFSAYSGYYVWPRTLIEDSNVTQVVDRRYMTTAQTDDAVNWIRQQSANGDKPWMCTVSYGAIHTPYQQPPTALYPPGFEWPTNVPEGNHTGPQIKVVSHLMLYALDHEIGRLMVGAGLAERLPNGNLLYRPEATNTMVIVCGDNGTFYASVYPPYNPLRAKASPYQTGISAPLIVSGPMVKQPGRTVSHMVNAVDLFSLFGEIAGVNVRSVVPYSHILDCTEMLPYLTDPEAKPIRGYNFAEQSSTVPAHVEIPPSVFTIAGTKVGSDTLFDNEELALDHGAEWFGPGAPVEYATTCDVRANVYPDMTILPSASWTIRNENYKLVKSKFAPCDNALNPYEFYNLRPTLINPKGLDNSPQNLLDGRSLSDDEEENLGVLMALLGALLESEPICPGDGNLDKVVDFEDVEGLVENWGLPSVFDLNGDGITDQVDLEAQLERFGEACELPGRIRDGFEFDSQLTAY